jgi:hypothetical protein
MPSEHESTVLSDAYETHNPLEDDVPSADELTGEPIAIDLAAFGIYGAEDVEILIHVDEDFHRVLSDPRKRKVFKESLHCHVLRLQGVRAGSQPRSGRQRIARRSRGPRRARAPSSSDGDSEPPDLARSPRGCSR